MYNYLVYLQIKLYSLYEHLIKIMDIQGGSKWFKKVLLSMYSHVKL